MVVVEPVAVADEHRWDRDSGGLAARIVEALGIDPAQTKRIMDLTEKILAAILEKLK